MSHTPPFDCMTNRVAFDAERAQTRLETLQIAAGEALHVDVGKRGRGAVVLADLGDDLAGQRAADLGRVRPQQLADRLLVRRIAIAVQQAYRDGLDALGAQSVDQAQHLVRVERRQHAAVGEKPLVQLEAQMARRQRGRPLHEQIVHVVAVLAPDLDGVAKAARGDQRGARALALDQGVGEQRGAVHHVGDRGRGHARLLENLADPLLDRLVRLRGRGQNLGDAQERAGIVHHHEIGEGAADIRADAMTHIVASHCCSPNSGCDRQHASLHATQTRPAVLKAPRCRPTAIRSGARAACYN